VRVPFEALSLEALQGLIEAFVLREGTDYGPQEHRFEEKCASVRAQIEAGTAVIEFDPESEVALIVPAP
jgi:uncharacterized protein